MERITDIRKNRIDRIYEAMAMIAEGCYVYVCDVRYDYSRWSERAVDYFGLPGKYMYNAGKIWEEHIHEENREAYAEQIAAVFEGTGVGHDMQYRARRADGTYVVCTCKGIVLRSVEGEPEFFVGSIKNNESIGTVDTLTGLKNLYGFFEDLKGVFWQHKWSTILMIGATGFDDINDVYGYSFGNRVLQSLGRYLEGIFAGRGVVYRMDGTKFCILTSELTLLEIENLYKVISEKHSHDFYVDGKHLSLSLNAGAVVLDNFEISKETAYTQSAFLLSFAITNYTKGKKSVRTFEGGRERFDNALDAASILTKYAEGSNKRIGQIVNRINKVRNAEKNKDDAVDLNKYGAQRAQEHKKAKEEAKAKPKKEEPKNQMKK